MLESLAPLVTGLIDLSVDVPSVFTFAVSLAALSACFDDIADLASSIAQSSLLKGAAATREEVEELAKAMISEEDDDEEEIERGRTNFLAAFDKLGAAQ